MFTAIASIRNLAICLLLVTLAFTGVPSAQAQASPTTTTLSTAVSASDSASTVVVASATNINAPALPFSQGGLGSPSAAALTLLMVDNELMRVNGVSGTTISVERGYNGTTASAHAASAKVYVGPASYFTGNEPSGVCVSTQQPVLPRVSFSQGPTGRKARLWNCGNSTWTTFDGYVTTIGAAIASASTIAPTNPVHHVTGTTNVVNITLPPACPEKTCTITLIPDGLWSTTNAGNIAIATTGVVSKALILTYDPGTSKWYPSY